MAISIEFSPEDKLACIEREYRMRLKVYPRWVLIKRMSQQQADKELALMAAIAEDYRKLAKQELLL